MNDFKYEYIDRDGCLEKAEMCVAYFNGEIYYRIFTFDIDNAIDTWNLCTEKDDSFLDSLDWQEININTKISTDAILAFEQMKAIHMDFKNESFEEKEKTYKGDDYFDQY